MGRFLNADALVSTGQGILGNNMFAYCQNSPVDGSDPCGTCFHRLDFWNDCSECGAKTLCDKWNDTTVAITDFLSDQADVAGDAWQDFTTWATKAGTEVFDSACNFVDDALEKADDLWQNTIQPVVTAPEFKEDVKAGIDIVVGTAEVVGGICALCVPELTTITKIGGWAAIVSGVGTIVNGMITLRE